MVRDQPLALKYRPRSFSELVGQRVNSVVLQRMAETDRVPHGLLFSGPSGSGKTTAARVLASEMQASDVIEVDAASNGGVDQIRKLLEVARYATGDSHRVLVLDEAHSITRQGFEALLKTLEEPPSNTVFVLVTTEPGKIPETVLSRLVEFTFRAVSEAAVLDRLASVAQQEQIPAETDLLRLLAQRCGGNVRTALSELDRAGRAGTVTLAEYLELVGDPDRSPALLAACASGDHSRVFTELDSQLSAVGVVQTASGMVSCLRDLLVLRSGGAVEATGDAYEVRRSLAMTLEPERLLAAIRVLWEVNTKLTHGDPRGMLEMALVLITEAFTRGREILPTRKPEPAPLASDTADKDRKMTLSDIQKHGAAR